MNIQCLELLSYRFDNQLYLEEFRDVAGYEGVYSVSNFGRVFSHLRIVSQSNRHGGYTKRPYGGKLLKWHFKPKTGYETVDLTQNGKTKTISVHRLVALAFIENPESKSQVNHIDGNKRNNFFKNLEWSTCKENIQHSFAIGLSKSGRNHKKSKPIAQYSESGLFIQNFESSGDIFRKTGMRTGCISSCARGERKKAYGFIWRFI